MSPAGLNRYPSLIPFVTKQAIAKDGNVAFLSVAISVLRQNRNRPYFAAPPGVLSIGVDGENGSRESVLR